MDTARERASVALRVRETGRTCRGPTLLFLSPPLSLRLYPIPETRSLHVHTCVYTETHTTPYLQHAPRRVYAETHKACTCAYGQCNTRANTCSRCTRRHITCAHMRSHTPCAGHAGVGSLHMQMLCVWIHVATHVTFVCVCRYKENIYFCFIDYTKAFDFVDHNKLWKILKEMEIPGHPTCLLRNLYAGQEATVRTGHGTTDWFLIRKGVCQGCI